MALEDLDGAARTFEELIALRREHPERSRAGLARALTNLGDVRRTQGRLEEAEKLLLEALEIQEEVLPADHPERGSTLNNLVALLWTSGIALARWRPTLSHLAELACRAAFAVPGHLSTVAAEWTAWTAWTARAATCSIRSAEENWLHSRSQFPPRVSFARRGHLPMRRVTSRACGPQPHGGVW